MPRFMSIWGQTMDRNQHTPLGVRLQHALDRMASTVCERPGGPALLGIALGVGVVAGGITMFIVVWAIVVGLFA